MDIGVALVDLLAWLGPQFALSFKFSNNIIISDFLFKYTHNGGGDNNNNNIGRSTIIRASLISSVLSLVRSALS